MAEVVFVNKAKLSTRLFILAAVCFMSLGGVLPVGAAGNLAREGILDQAVTQDASDEILSETSELEGEITLAMIMEAYGTEFIIVVLILLSIISVNVITYLRTKNELKVQTERVLAFSQTSNECFYEYNIKTGELVLSEKSKEVLGSSNLDDLISLAKDGIDNKIACRIASTIELCKADGEKGIFKSFNTPVYDNKGNPYSVIGKLVDVTLEAKEKEKQRLNDEAELDGLTGLYNADKMEELVNKCIAKATPKTCAALIKIDCDKFKSFNDTYGYLQGDIALKNVGKAVSSVFTETVVKGRVGGDEFCVYLPEVPAIGFALAKCKEFLTYLEEANTNHKITASLGIALLDGHKTYDELIEDAESAIIQAKNRGGNQIRFSKQN